MRPCRICGRTDDMSQSRVLIGDYLCRPCFTSKGRQREPFRSALRRADPVEGVRVRAREKARAAIRSGALVRQACEVCGDGRTQAHHDDYSKPLDVRWLCHEHHREWHAMHPAPRNIAAKLSPAQITEIEAAIARGVAIRTIARRFGISRPAVWRIGSRSAA